MSKIPTFGIFEGGGSRGLAHIGAISVCEERQIQFVAVAGTSAGAIIAALVAAGYSGSELLRPKSQNEEHLRDPQLEGLFNCDTFELIQQNEWKRLRRFSMMTVAWKKIAPVIAWPFANSGRIWGVGLFVLGGIGALVWGKWEGFVKLRYVSIGLSATFLLFLVLVMIAGYWTGIWNAMNRRGFLTTDLFVEKFNDWLAAKITELRPEWRPSHPDGHVTFEDLPLPLTVVSQCVQSRKLVTFSRVLTPVESVATAVAASMAIPGVFCPIRRGNDLLMDGGAISVFPAWATDGFFSDLSPYDLKLGFRLVSDSVKPVENLGQYFVAVFHALVYGDDSLQTRQVRGLKEIAISTGLTTGEFELTSKQKLEAWRHGRESAGRHLTQINRPPNEKQIKSFLRSILGLMRQSDPALANAHLRANIAFPIDDGALKICCHVHFGQDDTDDQLSFKHGQGATGKAWTDREIVVCDLAGAAATFNTTWKMDKYQQACVRKSLKALLSLPIASGDDWTEDQKVRKEATVYGVLNIDSDENVLSAFSNSEVHAAAIEGVSLIAAQLSQSI